jgi:hypothetical protein
VQRPRPTILSINPNSYPLVFFAARRAAGFVLFAFFVVNYQPCISRMAAKDF